jgi:hypothetical protein
MRIFRIEKSSNKPGLRLLGYTLHELLMSMTTSVLIIGGIVYSNLLGLKIQELSKSKLNAAQDARKFLNNVFSDIRSAQRIDIGNTTCSTSTGMGAVFTMATDGNPQCGNSIRIYPAVDGSNHVNTNFYVHYFYHDQSTSQCLRRCIVSNSTYNISKVAKSISNQNIFTSEDIFGNTVTNRRMLPKPMGIYLQFYEIVYPKVAIGTQGLYESYQYRTRVSCRTDNPAGN